MNSPTISESLFNLPFFYYEKTDSTNTRAKEYCLNFSNKTLFPAIFQAGMQTNGRGRMGRDFFSPKNCGIYISYLIDLIDLESARAKNRLAISVPFDLITPITAIAVCRTVDEFRKDASSLPNEFSKAQIKWVNDVFIAGKKVSGILTEGVVNSKNNKIEKVIIGIGINLNGEFPSSLKNIAGTCGISSEKRQDVVKKLSKNLFLLLCGVDLENPSHKMVTDFSELLNEYKARSVLIGKEVQVAPSINLNQNFRAKVLDINEKCHLIVQKLDDKNETIELFSGEVSVKL